MGHVARTDEGYACRYCGREYEDESKADAHVDELARAGMLGDHMAIHSTGTDARRPPFPYPSLEVEGEGETPSGLPPWVEALMRRDRT